MYIASVPNRDSPPAILLRESYREGKRVRNRTLANLTKWPLARIEALRHVLKDEPLVSPFDAFQIVRSLPHGHVMAALGSLRRLGIDTVIHSRKSIQRDLVVAMIVARLLDPASKLATARGLGTETAFSSLGAMLGVETATEDDLYDAMDWLLPLQPKIEKVLATRHLAEGGLALFDLTTVHVEGRTCPLAKLGHPHDDSGRGKLQIAIGLLCNKEGCPVAVQVLPGNTADPKALAPQIRMLRERFALKHVVIVGDRGMITQARIREDIKGAGGVEWITALRAPQIKRLMQQGVIQISLFDQRDLVEIAHPDYPGERLMVCRNPALAHERTRKREDLLKATERDLAEIRKAATRTKRRLHGKDKIGVKVGRVLYRYKVGKHFSVHIQEDDFSFERRLDRIAEEAALDGIYVIRTSVKSEALSADECVRSYKALSSVERAFRCLKTVDLKVRPIYHRLEARVSAHVFLCMLAYYVEWHMRKAVAPLLFEDDDKPSGEALRPSPVAPAQRSPKAEAKASTKRTETGLPVHSFQSLLKDLATLTRNRVRVRSQEPGEELEMLASPTAVQQRALDLLGVKVAL
ncbi:MAG: IS1634 family transposase [Patescibacteria group bacterium]